MSLHVACSCHGFHGKRYLRSVTFDRMSDHLHVDALIGISKQYTHFPFFARLCTDLCLQGLPVPCVCLSTISSGGPCIQYSPPI